MLEKPVDKKYPDEKFHGKFKQQKFLDGSRVIWWRADKNVTSCRPGDYISRTNSEAEVLEEKYFPFGKEVFADQKYQEFIELMKKQELSTE